MDKSKLGAGRVALLIILGIIALMLVFGSFGIIHTGDRGVKTRLGQVAGVITPGFYVKAPFIEHVDVFDVQTQKEQTDATAASQDLQTVKAEVAINYNLDSTKLSDLYTRIGDDYQYKVIDPAVQEVVKAVTAQYTAEELITKRADVTSKIQSALSDKLGLSDIAVSSVSIINFDFSAQFNQAIEAKVTAEQNALAAKNKLDQVKYEAEQTVTTAQAQAEAIKIQAQAINSQGGADYVQLQAVQKWDGKLPTQMVPGSSVPFINVSAK